MTIERPIGGRMGDMTIPPKAWPEANEDDYTARKTELEKVQKGLQTEKKAWSDIQSSIFGGRIWSGQAAIAGRERLRQHTDHMQQIDDLLTNAVAFHDHAFQSIANAKNDIRSISQSAQAKIDDLNSKPAKDDQAAQDRANQIDDIVRQALADNTHVVDAAAKAATTGQIYQRAGTKAAGVAAKDLRERSKLAAGSTPPAAPGTSSLILDSDERIVGPQEAQAASESTRINDSGQAFASPQQVQAPGRSTPTLDSAQNAGYTPPPQGAAPAPPTTTSAGAPTGSGSAPAPSLGGGGAPSTSGGSAPTASPAASGGNTSSANQGRPSSTADEPKSASPTKTGTGDTKDRGGGAGAGHGGAGGRAPADDFAKGLTVAQGVTHPQPNLAPAAAAAPLVTPVAQPADPTASAPVSHTAGTTGGSGGGLGGGGLSGGGGGGGSFGSPSSGTSMPPPMPLGPPAMPPPAGPPPTSTTTTAQPAVASNAGPGVNPASTNRSDIAAGGMAPVPVSPARMERDAAISASTAGALRRQRGAGNSSAALIQARRIAAALNMNTPHYGFFWVTGLTADGSIVVANSYGLGYIPDGIDLPPQVTMASADESIPAAERAKWVTYPILAIQGWARAHEQKLRAVIATAEQFANFDPGVPKVVLQQDDIPESGKLDGRSRLAVISAATAARLASVADGSLQDLLPAAPTDVTPPEDRLAALWFELTKPLMSTASNRGHVHLEAFIKYALHAQELALHKAHTATESPAQRAAIADWVYWQHLSVIMSDAITEAATV